MTLHFDSSLFCCCMGRSFLHALPIEVERFEDGVFVGSLVEGDVADFTQQGEVDDAGGVLLVVRHQFVEAVVVLAVEEEGAVVFFDEADGLLHLVFGEIGFQAGEVELAHQSPGYGIAVQHGAVFGQGKAFEGVAYGVPQVEGFADAMFVGVLLHNVFFYLHGAAYQWLEQGIVGLCGVEVQQGCPVGGVAYQAVLQHFCVAGEEVAAVQCAEECCFEQHGSGGIESAYFVFQPIEVDACFASHGGIHHGEEGGGQVDVGNAPLEGSGGKAPEVGDHASAQVDEQGVAGGQGSYAGLRGQ